MSDQAAATAARRGNRSVPGMLWSLLPVTAIVVVLVILFKPSGHPTPTVDPGDDFAYAGQVLHQRVLQPHDLPAAWRATSSAVSTPRHGTTAASVRVGYLISAQDFAELVESNRPAADLVRVQLSGARRTGAATIAGREWTRYRTARGETAYAVQLGRLSAYVTGNAADAQLRTLAASLR